MSEEQAKQAEVEQGGESGDNQGNRNEANSNPLSNLYQVLTSFINLDLYRDAKRDFEDINWNLFVVTTFHIGIVLTALWSAWASITLGINYLVSSGGIVSAISRFITIGPLLPIGLFIFVGISRWSVDRLQRTQTEEQNQSGRWVTVLLVSVIAILVAGVYRWATHTVANQLFGQSLSAEEMTTLMMIDGLYIGLLLIGIGGLGTIIIPQEAENNG